MESKAILRNLRFAPRKVRLVAGLLRGKNATEARAILQNLPKGSSLPFLKLLQSAVANAKQKISITDDKLVISEIQVDMAPRLKRYEPRAMGKADVILKHASHIKLILKSTVETAPAKPAKQPAKAATQSASKKTGDSKTHSKKSK
ncbi:50S ribosomal protein L22 [Candidatus Parcubacteria bacterium]|jgi:large subunit ribosomal protein L22|nr:MAG: 50S ribosomal protein L22 [Candidatus Parcubacteria bacterium]